MRTITQKVVRRARQRGVVVLTRRQWGSKMLATYQWRRFNRSHKLLPKFPVDTVWQHITVTFDSGELTGDFKTDMQTIERIGKERFGSGFSYNWGIDMKTGMVGLGQALDAAGTHTVNDKGARTPQGEFLSFDQNYVSIAFAVLGMPGDKLSREAEDALVELIVAHIEVGAVTKKFDYLPHNLVAFKSCPCPATEGRMDDIRQKVREAFAV